MVSPVVIKIAVAIAEKAVVWIAKSLPKVIAYVKKHHLLTKESCKNLLHSLKPNKERAKIVWSHLVGYISKARFHIWKIIKMFFHFGVKDLAGRLIPKYLTQLEHEHLLHGKEDIELHHLIEIYKDKMSDDITWATENREEAELVNKISKSKDVKSIIKLIAEYIAKAKADAPETVPWDNIGPSTGTKRDDYVAEADSESEPDEEPEQEQPNEEPEHEPDTHADTHADETKHKRRVALIIGLVILAIVFIVICIVVISAGYLMTRSESKSKSESESKSKSKTKSKSKSKSEICKRIYRRCTSLF